MSDNNNPYSTPASDLTYRPDTGQQSGGNYDWTINDVLNEAWQKTRGFKLVYIVAIIVYLVISQGLSTVINYLASDSLGVVFIGQLLIGLITYPLAAGLMMMGVKRSLGLDVNFSTLFDYFNKAVPLFIMMLLASLIMFVGFVLLIIPGIYIAVAYSLALPLMVEKNLGIWEALETSRKAITHCWFRFFGLILIMILIIILSILPLGIGLIWTLPMLSICTGIVYRELFGVDNITENQYTETI